MRTAVHGRRAVLLCGMILLSGRLPRALAWGVGHQDVARQVFSNLPAAITDPIPADVRANAIKVFALYPDSMADFRADEIGDSAIRQLKADGINNRYGIHTDRGRAMAFVLLVQAFRQHEDAHVAAWIAALSHSTSDMAAINHDPLVHGVIYTSAYKLQLPDGKSPSATKCFDISDLARDHGDGSAAWDQQVPPLLLKDDGRDAETALVDVMSYGQEGADFCATRGIPILTDAIAGVEQNDHAAWVESRKRLAELGAWAVGRTVRDVCVAARLAGTTDPVELTPAIQANYEARNDRFLHERRITDDALFAPVLRPLTASGVGVVGVVVEPTWRMNDAMLGYGDRIAAASICRSLGKASRAYATLDVRDLLTAGIPAPQQMPVLILSATALRDYGWMKVADLNRRLQSYLDAGGRVVWIGGPAKPPAALATITTALSRTPRQQLPTLELLQSKDGVGVNQLVLRCPDERGSWAFTRPVLLNIGWTQPLSPWRFDRLPPELQPLLVLRNASTDTTVGVLWTAGQPRAAYLPVYALAPHVLVADTVLHEPTAPELEEPARTILFDVLDRLAPPKT